ncbi:hypothetical protein Bca4012_083573 [Brassica carinata]
MVSSSSRSLKLSVNHPEEKCKHRGNFKYSERVASKSKQQVVVINLDYLYRIGMESFLCWSFVVIFILIELMLKGYRDGQYL